MYPFPKKTNQNPEIERFVELLNHNYSDPLTTMRYNPFVHAKMEADYITKKNNPNTFNNIFSRDVRVEKLRKYETNLLNRMRKTRASEPILKKKVPFSSDYAEFTRTGGFLPDLPQRNSNKQHFEHQSGYKPPLRDISYPVDPLWNQRLNYDEAKRQYKKISPNDNLTKEKLPELSTSNQNFMPHEHKMVNVEIQTDLDNHNSRLVPQEVKRIDKFTNSDQNEHKVNIDQNIKYFFDPEGPHTPLVDLEPEFKPYGYRNKRIDYNGLNPKYLHKKYVELRFSRDNTDERYHYFMNRLNGLGYKGGMKLSLPLLKKRYRTTNGLYGSMDPYAF